MASCAVEVAPKICDVIKGRVAAQASAIWQGSRPFERATSIYASIAGHNFVLTLPPRLLLILLRELIGIALLEYFPDKRPAARGENETKPTFS